MNIKPKNYTWDEFYDNVIDLIKHNASWQTMYNSYKAIPSFTARWLNVIRVLPWFEQIKYYREIRRRLDEDPQFRPFFEGQTIELPEFYVARIQKSLGALWEWLPEGALYHDQNAYLKAQENSLMQLDNSSSQE